MRNFKVQFNNSMGMMQNMIRYCHT